MPVSAWGHPILHAATLIWLTPIANHQYSPLQLVSGSQPNISHLRTFGCAVYVPIAPPQRTKISPQRRLGIYIGFDSPSIIRYLEPMTGDTFTARFADCHFDETIFPPLGGDKTVPNERRELMWTVLYLILTLVLKKVKLKYEGFCTFKILLTQCLMHSLTQQK